MEIREAKVSEVEDILEFIRNNWKSNHVYVEDKEFFKYEVLEKDKINFILGIEDNTIKATLGYIKYSEDRSDVFTIIWKNIGSSLLGLKCLEFLIKVNKGSISSCGINPKTKKIYDYLGFNTGKLEHYYILNTEIEEYKIAKINFKEFYENPINLSQDLEEVIPILTEKELESNITTEILSFQNIYKSKSYLVKRYLKHPYYKYELFFYKKALIVVKIIKENNSECLRIIDFIGDEKLLPELTKKLIKRMKESKYEYIDFYQYGISREIMKRAGFVKREEKSEDIIPNYFEPFEKKNIDIYYMTNLEENFKIFKGDGDQDRPSILKKGEE